MDNHWLVRRSTIRILWILFIVVLALTVLAEFFVSSGHHGEDEGHSGVGGSFAFSAWFGFSTCVVLIVISKVFGVFLKRKDTYYDD